MSSEEETNKKKKKHKEISKDVADRTSKGDATSNSADIPKVEKCKDKYDVSVKPKIPDLQQFSVKCVEVQKGVRFDDALLKSKIEAKVAFPELLTKTPVSVSIKNVVFSQDTVTLKDTSLRTVKVPDFKIYGSPNIEMRNTDFNVSIVNTVMPRNLSVPFPSLHTAKMRPLIIKNISFDAAIGMKIKEFGCPKMQSIDQKSYDARGNGSDSNMDLPWDGDIHKKLFFLGGSSSAEDFKIIAVPDKQEYYEFVAMNFRDVYRIEHGGNVYDVVRKQDIDELKEEFGKQTASHEIVIVKISDGMLNKDNMRYIMDIIKNKPYQGLGLVVFVVSNPAKFREEIGTSDDVLILEESDFQQLLEKSTALTKIIQGFNNYSVSSGNFGDEFKNSIVEFDRKIEQYKDALFVEEKLKGFEEALDYFTKNIDLLDATQSSSEKEASDIHSGMKGFIYVCEVKNGNKAEFEADEEHQADVAAGDKYYEAETLFGRKDVMKLLAEKMKKDGYSSGNQQIVFTFRNIDIIRNFFYLRQFLKHNKDSKIEICGFDLEHEKLISLGEIIKVLM